MGLDQTGYAKDKDGNEIELQYWRKHNALEGWMASIYVNHKGGKESFNCVEIELIEDEIDMLEESVLLKELPVTAGFFFGSDTSRDEYNFRQDLEFIDKARKEFKKGNKIYYSSSW